MNKFLVMFFAFLLVVTYNETFAARKKTGKKAKSTQSREYKAKKKAKKTTKAKKSKTQASTTENN